MEETGSLQKNECMQNSIDRLHVEVLISIVSLLSVKEAGRTSVLSRRWRYLWLFNPILDFDGSERVHELGNSSKSIEDDKIRFVHWVNRVVSLYSRETIDEFRVLFNLNNNNANDINRWIEFALRKRVKRLELNLEVKKQESSLLHAYFEYYGQSRCVNANTRQQTGHLCILPLCLSTCDSLVALCLTKVHVTEEILKFFTSNCSNLEELRVENGDGFKNLTINSQESRLRHLAIINCQCCYKLELCLPNLVSCTFSGFSTTLVLKDVSSLANLSLGAVWPGVLFNNLLNISGYLSRLEMLTLCTRISKTAEDLVLPSLPRLKKLVLDLDAIHSDSFLSCTPLNIINVAPLLHEIVMKLTCWPSPLMQRKARHPNIGEKHHGLKVFEMVGFANIAVAVEVALYVLEYAASLEKVVVNEIATTGRGIDLFKQDLATHSCFLDNQYAQYSYDSSI